MIKAFGKLFSNPGVWAIVAFLVGILALMSALQGIMPTDSEPVTYDAPSSNITARGCLPTSPLGMLAGVLILGWVQWRNSDNDPIKPLTILGFIAMTLLILWAICLIIGGVS